MLYINLQYCESLKFLNLENNALQYVDMDKMDKLTELQLSLNEINEIEISADIFPELISIDLSHNHEMNVSSISNLISKTSKFRVKIF